jgi:hypothetical protein
MHDQVPPLEKHPTEVESYSFNFGRRLASGETLTGSPTVERSPASSLTLSNVTISGPKVLFTASGGTNNIDYTLTCTVTTSLSRTLVGCGTLKVRSC